MRLITEFVWLCPQVGILFIRIIACLLAVGCVKGAEVINIQVKLHDLQLTGSISPALYSAAASDCVRACLRHADCALLQPVMRLEVRAHLSLPCFYLLVAVGLCS